MRYRQVGKTDLMLSVVGFGTAQLRYVPRQQAFDTLCKGFDLGVNWVHTAVDYDGAEAMVAKAIAKGGHKNIHVASNAPGPLDKYQDYFESTCRILGKKRLSLFGIAGIDYCEDLGHNIWGAGGMIEFLRQKKNEQRLDAMYCSTHGAPEYVEKLITSGCFDAIMIAHNPLGFHVLSYYGKAENKEYENIDKNVEYIFPLAKKHNVSLLVMKPLAGGLLCHGKAFPERKWFSNHALKASDVLRAIIKIPEVCAVVPGTASLEEAEENALAGYAEDDGCIAARQDESIHQTAHKMRADLCSRCGKCEDTCSHKLRISWLFREAYIWNYPADAFEALTRLHYFKLHPLNELICTTCTHKTCFCPSGIDIPNSLAEVHVSMLELRNNKLMHPLQEELDAMFINGPLPGRVILSDIPQNLKPGQKYTCRVWLENVGGIHWSSYETQPEAETTVGLLVEVNRRRIHTLPLYHDVPHGMRTYFAFDLDAPILHGKYALSLSIVTLSKQMKVLNVTLLITKHVHVLMSAETKSSTQLWQSVVYKYLSRRRKESCSCVADFSSRQIKKQLKYFAKKILHRCGLLERGPVIRTEASYGVRFIKHNIPQKLPALTVFPGKITIENTGEMTWLGAPDDGRSVAMFLRHDDQIKATLMLPRSKVHPGERVTLYFALNIPAALGTLHVMFDMVEHHVTLFRDFGVPPLKLDITIAPPRNDPHDHAWNIAWNHNPWHFMPTRGICRGAKSNVYPIITKSGKGCTLYDLNGTAYTDYIMGWGSLLLGYAHDDIQQAILETVKQTSPMLPYPHPLEIEVSQMLCEDFPSAEMAIFGKNGSDVCTLASRIARVLTGKKVILCCGYHGWQDFWVEQLGFSRTGVPEHESPLILPFIYKDRQDFFRLYEKHKKNLAAIMLEPAGPLGSDEIGLAPDANREFLETTAAAARDAGAMLIFDEIVTGYRYPQGSVQQATGVIPDLTCLGKALASGMPLAALVGRAEIMLEGMPRTRYAPTFKGEIYSFAAAKAAINIYRTEPVSDYVWNYGHKLKQGINELCEKHEINAKCTGAPFRMILEFSDRNPERLALMKTLYFQELLLHKISTYNGIMIPSYAHTAKDLEFTLSCVDNALKSVAEAHMHDDFDNRVEIPLLADII